jgi:hypothetical protein
MEIPPISWGRRLTAILVADICATMVIAAALLLYLHPVSLHLPFSLRLETVIGIFLFYAVLPSALPAFLVVSKISRLPLPSFWNTALIGAAVGLCSYFIALALLSIPFGFLVIRLGLTLFVGLRFGLLVAVPAGAIGAVAARAFLAWII